ncbi:hypothetical protein Tco_1133925 [Tanacetum coccineum]
MFAELDEAYDEDFVSYLDEPVIFLVDNEITKDDAIESSCSNVPSGRPRKRKRVEFDKTASGYAPTRNPRKRKRLIKHERYATDFVDDVEE